jgi:cytochrome c nitrite reductase small subunit
MSRKRNIVIAVLLAVVVIGGVGAVAFWEYHERPEFCATCHIMEPYLASWQASDYGAYEHAIEGVTCLECHVPTVEQQVHELVVYMQGDYGIPLEEMQVSDGFCYDCHLEDEHASLEEVVQRTADRELNPHESHLIGEIDCDTCHNMHQASEDYCADCHGPVATGPGWTTPVSLTAEIDVWEPDMDCAVCHVMVPYMESLEDVNLLAYTHVQEGLECLDCHNGVEAVKQVHEEAVAGEPIPERKVEMEFCFDCHFDNEHTSYEQIVELTADLEEEVGANPHDSHYGQMECRLCHKMHKESEDYCAQCHAWGWEVP